MGGNSPSTPGQASAPMLNGLQGRFLGNTGYQQTPVPPIAAPQYGGPILPTPEQAAAATVARMQARTPMAAPAGAPMRQMTQPISDLHNRADAFLYNNRPKNGNGQ